MEMELGSAWTSFIHTASKQWAGSFLASLLHSPPQSATTLKLQILYTSYILTYECQISNQPHDETRAKHKFSIAI